MIQNAWIKNACSPFRLLILALALLAAGCGSASNTDTAATNEQTRVLEDQELADETDDSLTSDDDASDEGVTPEPGSVDVVAASGDDINGGKPESVNPGDAVPAALQVDDIIDGDGNTAAAGDLLVMHYVGVLQDGTEFDSSWDRGETFSFTLGQGRVIQGWDDGIVGMQEGGRRILSIPSEQAYGVQSPSPDIPANSPLYFVVDLVQTISAPDVENVEAPATELEVTVLEEGDGEIVELGDVVDLHFVAILHENGEEIGSTFLQGQPATIEIGADPTQLLAGFDEAIPGNAVGSWLRIVVPPELGLPENPDSGLPPEPTIVAEVLIAGIRDL